MTFRSLFITGTDTGVGKTTFSCALARALRRRELRVGVMKPAETGCPTGPDGSFAPQDALRLRAAAGSQLSLDLVCPFTFGEPLAPAVAAERAGTAVDLAHVRDRLRVIESGHDITLVEGAGGLLVPLTTDLTFADFARDLELPVVIVVGSKLGAINHALLTDGYARALGLDVLGYVVNFPQPGSDLAADTNIAVLRSRLGEPIAILPHVDGDAEISDEAAARVLRRV